MDLNIGRVHRGSKPAEQAAKLGAIDLGSACHSTEHFAGSGGAKLGHRYRFALPVSRYSYITVNGGQFMQ
jgi:hypothetical protein